MERDARYFLVGLMLLASILILVVFLIWTANTPDTQEKSVYTVDFRQSVSGLGKGSRVSYLGVPVGKVTDLGLGDQGGVRVEIAVEPGTPISATTVAALSTSGLTGQSTIELENLPDSPILDTTIESAPDQPVQVIPGKASAIGKLTRSAPIIAEQAEEALIRMNRLLSDTNLENAGVMLENMGKASAEIETAAIDTRKMMDEVRETNRQLQSMIPDYSQVAQRLNDTVLPGFANTSTELDRTSRLIARQMTDSSTAFREFIAESRLSMQVVRDQILEATRKAEQLTEDLREDPSRLIYKQKEVGLELED